MKLYNQIGLRNVRQARGVFIGPKSATSMYRQAREGATTLLQRIHAGFGAPMRRKYGQKNAVAAKQFFSKTKEFDVNDSFGGLGRCVGKFPRDLLELSDDYHRCSAQLALKAFEIVGSFIAISLPKIYYALVRSTVLVFPTWHPPALGVAMKFLKHREHSCPFSWSPVL